MLLAQTAFPGLPGFLGTRGSLMLDLVFLAMFLVVPAMGLSIYLVKFQRLYQLHKTIQIVLAAVLLIAVLAFEVDMRFGGGWKERAAASPYWGAGFNRVWQALAVHLCFAVPTPFLWIFVIVQALRKFPAPLRPGPYSATHIFWARLAAIGMTMTAVTGWVFYWLAFVA
jgi:putative membrane protein